MQYCYFTMPLDTASLEIFNLSNETLYFYRQFTNCFECPLLQAATLEPNGKSKVNIATFFDQHYWVTNVNTTYLEDGTKENYCNNRTLRPSFYQFEDQGIYNLTINEDAECHMSMVQEGRNNLLQFSYITFIYFCLMIIFYLGYRYIIFKRLEKDEDEQSRDGRSTNADAERYAAQLEGYNSSGRFGSIDAFRGVTIILMIFVNYGAGQYKYLQHAPWDGLHLADVVFPFFIFIMGVSIVISFRNLAQQTSYNLGRILSKIFIRSFKLFLLGLIVNSIGAVNLDTLRIPGVLQRFSISYGVVASIHVLSLYFEARCTNLPEFLRKLTLYCPQWIHLIASVIMFVIYYCLTFLWRYDDDCPIGYVGPGGLYANMSNVDCIGGAAHRIDMMLFTPKHVYRNNFASILYDPDHRFRLWHDPEGVLGTTTSIILTLVGAHAGHILLSNPFKMKRMVKWMIFSGILAVITLFSIFVLQIPINKNLWSFSFVMLTGTIAMLVFVAFYYLIDWQKCWLIGWPFHYAGQNSILLYVGHEVVHDMLPFAFVTYNNPVHVWHLLSNLVGVTVWLVISSWLAKNNIFLKV